MFCLAICGGLGGDYRVAVPAAASLELVHRTSLIFDDIQDVGKERNGEPTVWAIWGKEQAINAGLALSCYARLIVQNGLLRGITDSLALRILEKLENAVLDLCWGQYYDLSFQETVNVGVDDYLRMIGGKTAALFQTACEVGALCADWSRVTASQLDKHVLIAGEFGRNMGLAFQIHDDYLGIWGDESVVGKTANDIAERKRSLPVVLAIAADRERVESLFQLKSIGQEQENDFRDWMERVSIPDKVKELENGYIQAAEKKLKELDLQDQWDSHFKDLIDFLRERKV